MSTYDDEHRSVRIEIDGGLDRAGSSPSRGVDVDATPTSRAVMLGALFAVGLLIVGALVALSPDRDAAADGTERAAPVAEDATAASEPVPDPAGNQRAPRTNEPPIRISDVSGVNGLGFGISEIVSAGVGYLALEPNQGFAPKLFRSVDGLSWTEVDDIVVNGDPIDLFDRRWRDLTRTSDGFAITSSGQFLVQREVYVSETGVEWVEADDLSESVADRTRPLYPVFARGSSVTGFQLRQSETLRSIAETHTDLDEPDRGFCGVFPGRASSPTFQIMDCSFASAGSLTSERIDSAVSPERIFTCLQSLPDNGISVEYVHTISNGAEPLLETFGRGPGFHADIVQVDEDRVLFVDGLLSPLQGDQCDGVVEVPEVVPPQVAVFNSSTGAVERFDLPDELENALNTDGSGSVRAVGLARVSLLSDGHAVFVGGDDVWAMNVQSGTWSLLIRANEDRPRQPFDVSRIAVVRNRLFVVSGSRVVVFDLFEDELGDLDLDWSHVISNPDSNEDFVDGEILLADEVSLFITDGPSIWRYDVGR